MPREFSFGVTFNGRDYVIPDFFEARRLLEPIIGRGERSCEAHSFNRLWHTHRFSASANPKDEDAGWYERAFRWLEDNAPHWLWDETPTIGGGLEIIVYLKGDETIALFMMFWPQFKPWTKQW